MSRIHYDVHDLRALFEVARQGGFNRAANVLSITPSALSKRIAKVEAAIGGLIVERTTRTMQLTPLGKRLLARAEPLLHALDDCIDDASKVARGLAGQVAVGCVATVAFSHFPEALASFQKDFPNVRVQLRDGEGSQITAAVLDHQVEFAVTTVPGHHQDLCVEHVASDPFVVCCGAGHPLGSRQEVAWRELQDWKIAGFKPHVSTRQLVDRTLADLGLELSWFYEVGLLSSLLGLLRSGEFITPVPRLLTGFLPGLQAVTLVDPPVERSIYLVRRTAPLSVPAQSLWDTLLRSMREGAPAPEQLVPAAT